MRVLIVAAALFVLASSVQAQMILPTPQLVVEHVLSDQQRVEPGMSVAADATVALTCPMPGYVSTTDWVVTSRVRTSAPDLVLSAPVSHVVPGDYCLRGGPSSEEYRMPFQTLITVPESYNATGVVQVRLEFEARSGPQWTDDARAEFSFEVVQTAAMHAVQEKSAGAAPRSVEDPRLSQEAPGPALPLVIGGLALLARRFA